jgi:hypothetical protein
VRAGWGPAAVADLIGTLACEFLIAVKPFRFHEHSRADHPLLGVRYPQRPQQPSMQPDLVINGPGEVSDETYPYQTTQGPERTPVA